MSNGKENEKKKATVLKIVSGKQPLHDSTSAILNRPPVEPEPCQSTLEAAIDEDAVLDPPAARTDQNESPLRSFCCEDTDKSPPSSPGYLDDLFEKLTDSETLGEKLHVNSVLNNQKAFFSIVSRGQGGTPDLSFVSGVGFSVGRGHGGIGQQESNPVSRGQGGISQQESTPVGRGMGEISQQESTPAGRGQGGVGQQESTPAGRGQVGINLAHTSNLSFGSGIDFFAGSEIQIYHWKENLNPSIHPAMSPTSLRAGVTTYN